MSRKLRLSTIKQMAPYIRSEEQLQVLLANVQNPRMRLEVEHLLRANAPQLKPQPRRPLPWHFTIDLRKAGWYGFVFDVCCPWFRILIAYRFYELKTDRWRWGAGIELANGKGLGRFKLRRLAPVKDEAAPRVKDEFNQRGLQITQADNIPCGP